MAATAFIGVKFSQSCHDHKKYLWTCDS